MDRRIPALDGIRALAILMVAYFHFWQQNWLTPPSADLALFRLDLYPVAAGGFVGVELLFVLSGFLLYLPLAQGKKLNIFLFYQKRFARIIPCYAVCVLVTGLFTYAEFSGLTEWLSYVFQNLLFMNMFRPSLLYNRFNSVLWSTAVEVWFYLFFPLFALWMKKAPRMAVLCTFLFSTLYRLWTLKFSGSIPFYMNQLPGMLDCFVAGMFTAAVVGKAKTNKHGSLLVCAGAALFLFVLFQMYIRRGSIEGIQYYQTLYRPFFILSGCMLIGGAALAPPLFQKILGNRVFGFVSLISFNLYLWHQWVAVKLRIWRFPPYLGDPHDDPVWQWQHMLLSFVLSIAIATLFTYAVEKPLGRLILRSGRVVRDSLSQET